MVRRTVEIPEELDAQVRSLLASRGGDFNDLVRESLLAQLRLDRVAPRGTTPSSEGLMRWCGAMKPTGDAVTIDHARDQVASEAAQAVRRELS